MIVKNIHRLIIMYPFLGTITTWMFIHTIFAKQKKEVSIICVDEYCKIKEFFFVKFCLWHIDMLLQVLSTRYYLQHVPVSVFPLL